MDETVADQMSEADLNPPPRWRRYVPVWLRRLIWIDEVTHYDAFLSYSWSGEPDVAVAVQSVIQRFLCPWYRLRAKTVFRDLSCLPTAADLEDELRKRIDRSEFLIVLASPSAAMSKGMEMEAAHWVGARRLNDVVIVIANGPPGDWLDVRAHLLPPSLRTWLTRQPIFVDLRAEVAALRANPNDPAALGSILEALKQLMLRLYPGSTWELLRGEERRQRRVALGWIGAVIIVLSTAAAIAGVAAYIALQQAAEAQQQRENADQATRVAIEARRRATEEELTARQALQRALSSDRAKDVAVSEKENSARIAELAKTVAEDRRIAAEASARQAEREKDRATVETRLKDVRTAESTARALSIASAEALPKNPQQALLLALHAAAQTWNSHRMILGETETALRAAAAANSVVLEVPLDNDVHDCTLSPDVSQVAAHTRSGRLVAIDLQSKARTDLGVRLPNAAAYPNAIGQLLWSSDGQRIGYESVETVSVIDLATRRIRQLDVPPSSWPEWDPTVRRVAVKPEGALSVWDSVREQWIFSRPSPAGLFGFRWNKSGSRLLTRMDLRDEDRRRNPPGTFNQEVTLWDVDGNRDLQTSLGPWPFWFDEKLAAGSSDGTRSDIAIFDVTDPAFAAGARVGKVDMGGAKYSLGAAFSPDSRFLAINGWEKVSVLDVHSGQEVFSFATDHFRGGNYHEGRWTADGLRLGMLIASLQRCDFVGVYSVGYLFSRTSKELVDAVRERVNGTLSSDYCERYLSTKVCPPLEFK